jgi:Tol biopolymer transport system component
MIRTIFWIFPLALAACEADPGPVIGPGLQCPQGGCLARAEGYHDPAWSPDGTRIALVKWGDTRTPPGLYLVNPDGSALMLLHPDPNLRWPAWNPTGDSVWAVSGGQLLRIAIADGSASVVASRGQHARPVANPVTGEILVHIDPKALKTRRDLVEEPGLYRLPSRRMVSSGSDGAWAPDGASYWWVEPVPGRPPVTRLIRSLASNDARADTLVVFSDRAMSAPALSPDQSSILFTADRLYRYRFATKTLIPITAGPAERASWRPDGARIAYSDGNGAIWAMDANGSGRIRLTP